MEKGGIAMTVNEKCLLFFIIIAPLFMGGEDGTLLLRKRSKHTPPAIKQVKYVRSSS
jgi:hypothetical protein